MGKYLLERNKKLYYRRRIPIELSQYFPNMTEIRIQFRKKSKFQGILYVEVLNSLFEEVMSMIFLDSTNEAEALAMKYLMKMKDIAKEDSPIITYSMAQFNNEQKEKLDKQLLDKTEKLNLSEKNDLLKNLDILDRLVTVIDLKKV